MTTLDELREAAERSGCGRCPGSARRSRRTSSQALEGAGGAEGGRRGRCSGTGLPAVLAVVEALREHPAAIQVSEAGSVAPPARDRSATSTSSRRPPTPAGADRRTSPAAVGRARSRRRADEGDGVSHDGLRFDLRVVPPECYGNLLQHFTGSKDHNVAHARGGAAPRACRSPSTASRRSRRGEVHTFADRGGALRVPRLPVHPARAARERRRARGGARGELPELVEERDLKGDLHAHTTWSADGTTRSRRWPRAAIARGYAYLAVTDHSHYLRDGTDGGPGDGARRAEREAEAVPAAAGRRGEHPRGRHARRLRRGRSPSSTGSSPRSTPRSRRTRPSGSSRRWRTRTSTAIGHLTGRKIGKRGADARRPRAGLRRRRSRRGTALEINSQPDRLDLRDADARLAGERGVPIVVSSDAHRLARSTTSRSASARRAARG